ncbi:MAG: polysaccharide biosynthesis tyrosine autokinase [Terracidiphilus sp.]
MTTENSTDLSHNRTSRQFYAPVTAASDVEPEAPPVPLSHYIWILRRQRWKMIAFIAACMLVTFIVSARLKPVYESTATIDIDLQAPSAVVGQGSTTPVDTFDPDVFFATQVKLIQSDYVLRPVAEQFHLLGGETGPEGSKAPGVQALASAPVSLGGLRVSRPTNTYLLLISYRSPDPRVAAQIANAVANSYLAETYNLRIRSSASLSSFMEQQLNELKAKMERSSQALAQFEKDMDVINPDANSDILSARLLQLNTEYTTAQADRVTKEAAWNAMKSGSVDAALMSSQGDSLVKLNDALNQARQRLAEVKATYGQKHPEYHKAASELAEVQSQFDATWRSVSDKINLQYRESVNREQMLAQAVTQAKAEWDRVNAKSFQYQQLKQEATADKALYDELITKIHDAQINAGFQSSDIRIADVARPSTGPVFPNTRLDITLAFLFSSLLAIGAALLHDALDTTLRDPEEASRYLGADVIGMLPLDRAGSLIARPSDPASKSSIAALASQVVNGNGKNRKGYYRSISGFEEAVRTIRNTILLSDFDQRLRSIALTSAEPGEGKTTLAVHLAIANAARGKSTLLLDSDLRRPSVHTRFGMTPREGLSNVLNGELPWQQAVIPVEGRPNLSVLPSGPGSHRAADLIGPRLSELLDEWVKNYDLVILDSPPLLGFAEGLQMATAADGVLIITRAGETRRKSVAAVVSTLQRVRANLIGVVLNQVTHTTSEDGYSYYGYHPYQHYQKPVK